MEKRGVIDGNTPAAERRPAVKAADVSKKQAADAREDSAATRMADAAAQRLRDKRKQDRR